MKAAAEAAVGLTAKALALPIRLLFPIGKAFCRFFRLAGLIARCEGTIPPSTQFDGRIRTSGRPRVELGRNCRLGADVLFETTGNGIVKLGRNVRVNSGSILVSHARIDIGDDVLIGEYVSIRDADHAIFDGDPIRSKGHVSAPISIGAGAWIARGCVVLKGVAVGAGAVVGANSVVTKDIPPRAIAVGSPARVIKFRE